MFCSLQCGAAFQEDDVVVLNGTKEDVQVLKSRMEERRLRAKLGKVTGPARPAPGRSPAPLRVCSDRGGCASWRGPAAPRCAGHGASLSPLSRFVREAGTSAQDRGQSVTAPVQGGGADRACKALTGAAG